MKGIVLAGGYGSRLHPLTISQSKQILPIYDKPMIYYSLSVLMLAGLREILLISTPNDIESYKNLLGSGSNFGIKINYAIQDRPNGLAEAFIIGENFINGDSVCLILGDNFFYGEGFSKKLKHVAKNNNGATIFAYKVNKPSNFGIVEFNDKNDVLSIEEKPKIPKSDYAVTGLYFYDNSVIEIAKSINPSERGELEITDINMAYLEKNNLNLELLGRGFAWLDSGTHQGLLDASMFVSTIEKRTGTKIACLEEIAWNNKWITNQVMLDSASRMKNSSYGKYLQSLID